MSGLSDDEVLKILELIDRAGVAAFELTMGDLHLSVGPPGGAPGPAGGAPGPPAPSPAAPPSPAVIPGPTEPAREPVAQAETGEDLVDVRAPLLGIFYRAPEPGAAPFVEPGSTVSPDSTVGLIEIMKMFNRVEAGVAGVVVEVCAENGSLVEMGQALIRIRPRGATSSEAGQG